MYKVLLQRSEDFLYEWLIYDKSQFKKGYWEFEEEEKAHKFFNNLIKKYVIIQISPNMQKNLWIVFIANDTVESKILVNNKM